jgi:hypothetical protein
MASHIKQLLTVLFLVGTAVGAYYLLQKFEVLNLTVPNASEVEAETVKLEAEVIAELKRIESITFNEELFIREDYQSLTDLSVTLPRPRLMRSNPFTAIP